MKKGSTRNIWTKQQIQCLRHIYPKYRKPVRGLVKRLGHSLKLIYGKAKELRLKRKYNPGSIREGERRSPGTEFKKGKAAYPRYGFKKGIHYSRATEFKKGHQPANTKYNGCIRIRIDTNDKTGKIRRYKWIRIRKHKWIMYHVYVWKKKYGRIPKDHIIVFRDGNTMNCRPNNLMCIDRQQHMENTRYKDRSIARYIASNGLGRVDKKLMEEIIKHPELLELKRKQMMLNKAIREAA